MKRMVFILTMLFSVSVIAADGNGKINVGDKATMTSVKMLDVSGEKVSIADIKKENGVLVLFSCNNCPFVLRWEDRYNELKKVADKNNVGMIVLNSNYKNRDNVDSFENMKQHAKEKGYNFRYVVDEESQVANAFGGQTTPHAFLFNSDLDLVYKGAIDDNYKSGDEVSKAYVKEAIGSLGQGKEVAVSFSKPVGCSIKRKVD